VRSTTYRGARNVFAPTSNMPHTSWLLGAIGFACQQLCPLAEAVAQSFPPSLSQLHHTSWTVRDGAPADAQALAQTADGYLWVGTATGLFRFDGLQFERFGGRSTPLRGNDISALAVGPNDGLWIGYRLGGVSLLSNGKLRTFAEVDGLHQGANFGFAFVGDTVWVAGSGGVSSYDGTRWRRLTRADGMNDKFSTAIMVDRRGRVWSSSREGLYLRDRNRVRFRLVSASLGGLPAGSLREAPDGVVWASSPRSGLSRLSDSAGTIAVTAAGIGPSSTGTVLLDRRGALWVADANGLERYTSLSPPLSFDGFSLADHRMASDQGLSGDGVLAIMEDREGNVWTATAGGIDRFRPNRLISIRLPKGTVFPTIVPIEQGTVIVASVSNAAVRVRDRAIELLGAPWQIEATSHDFDGNGWFAGPRNLWRLTGERFDPIELPGQIGDNAIQAVARDRSGTLWISVVRDGVWRLRDSVWRREGRATPIGEPATVIVPDLQRRVWFGTAANRITVLEGGHFRTLSAKGTLNLGAIFAIVPRDDYAWIGGERGVAIARGDSIYAPRGFEAFTGTSGIVETANGDLWLNATLGVIRIAAGDLTRTLADSAFITPYQVLDFRDGREGTATQLRPVPSAVQGSDGRLWFTTSSQVAWIDTTAFERNVLPPPVTIRSIVAGDSTYAPGDSIHLDQGRRNVQFNYAALSLSIPERNRFRYRMEGGDSAWLDAGDRRIASFTNLAPGAYRFQVIASNNDGVWNETGASQVFTIAPRFVETRWFYWLVVMTGGSVLWLLISMRNRQVARGLRARYSAKLEERTRIAQELHDTLLQGFTGITLQLEGVQRSLPARPEVAVVTLSRVLALADRTLRDARHMVWDMRAPELDTMDLAEAVGAAVRVASQQTEAVLHFHVHGETRRLPLALETAVLRVARESVANAVRHARAQFISAELTYAERHVVLCVSDNGRGLDVNEVEAASKQGHWGVEGMRGRAARLGGTLHIDSAQGGGTTITLTLPVAE
jgi:signal transduction histidine kinase/ligand-binding sensor domain-containing protein